MFGFYCCDNWVWGGGGDGNPASIKFDGKYTYRLDERLIRDENGETGAWAEPADALSGWYGYAMVFNEDGTMTHLRQKRFDNGWYQVNSDGNGLREDGLVPNDIRYWAVTSGYFCDFYVMNNYNGVNCGVWESLEYDYWLYEENETQEELFDLQTNLYGECYAKTKEYPVKNAFDCVNEYGLGVGLKRTPYSIKSDTLIINYSGKYIWLPNIEIKGWY